MTLTELINEVVADTLRRTVVTHQRRLAIKLGVRELSKERVAACAHHGWNSLLDWCDDCGVTKEELVFKTGLNNA